MDVQSEKGKGKSVVLIFINLRSQYINEQKLLLERITIRKKNKLILELLRSCAMWTRSVQDELQGRWLACRGDEAGDWKCCAWLRTQIYMWLLGADPHSASRDKAAK